MSEAEKKKIRVLAVDDHKLVLSMLVMALETLPDVELVGTATTAQEALTLGQSTQPHIILLDLNLNGTSSLTILPKLREVAPQARVLILTGETDEESQREAVRLGAVGLVLKETALEVLVKAIRKVHEGEAWLNSTMMSTLITEISQRPIKKVDEATTRIQTLSEREREVIELIGEGLKNKQIAKRLFISETTVHHHLTSIFSKLGVQDRVGLVIFALKHGLAKLPH